MEFYCVPKFKKDISKLIKKHRSTRSDVSDIKNIFETIGIPNYAIPYPGVSDNKCRKIKMICKDMGAGKSKGFRLIFRDLDKQIIFIHIYLHNQYSKEIDVVNEVKERLNYSENDLAPFWSPLDFLKNSLCLEPP